MKQKNLEIKERKQNRVEGGMEDIHVSKDTVILLRDSVNCYDPSLTEEPQRREKSHRKKRNE